MDTNRRTEEEISVCFSGGTDSTLAAYLVCPRFKKVHLVTYIISAMGELGRCETHAKKLQKVFGKDKVSHEFMNIEDLFKKIYYGTYLHDIRKYKTYLPALFCAACSFSWHIKTVIYNLENNIHFTCDGEQGEKTYVTEDKRIEGLKPMWSEQMIPVLKMVQDFYNEYGITYENPVYHVERTDWELYKLGFTDEKDFKLKGVASKKEKGFGTRYAHVKSTQEKCTGAVIGNLYLLGYYLPLHGMEANERMSIEYYREKIEVGKKYIQDYFDKKGVDVRDLI